jgi:hypothetical protein
VLRVGNWNSTEEKNVLADTFARNAEERRVALAALIMQTQND